MINEGGVKVRVEIGIGFYVWVFSFFILLIANILGIFSERTKPPKITYTIFSY